MFNIFFQVSLSTIPFASNLLPSWNLITPALVFLPYLLSASPTLIPLPFKNSCTNLTDGKTEPTNEVVNV